MAFDDPYLVWQDRQITRTQREQQNGHKAALLWLTGLPAAGKTTLAFRLEALLFARGSQTYSLDGDNVRHGLNKDLGFSPEDRRENIRRVGEVAALFVESGAIVLCSFISPYRADRDAVRALVAPVPFVEIFVDCSLAECERRDPKGLYKRARAGSIPECTGIHAPYEAPLAPELHIDTEHTPLEKSASLVMAYLEDVGIWEDCGSKGQGM